jgi:hypothetical protein
MHRPMVLQNELAIVDSLMMADVTIIITPAKT